ALQGALDGAGMGSPDAAAVLGSVGSAASRTTIDLAKSTVRTMGIGRGLGLESTGPDNAPASPGASVAIGTVPANGVDALFSSSWSPLLDRGSRQRGAHPAHY